MDLSALERSLCRARPGVVLVDARLLRRVIKHHRHLAGVGLAVPHTRSYAVAREVLLGVVEPEEIGRSRDDLPAEVILLPKPDAEALAHRSIDELAAELWRYAFHAEVHLALERRARGGELGDAIVRQRIGRIGQTEIDEIRAVLRQDGLLLPPGDDREVYVELCAIWFELKLFDPALLGRMFPSVHDGRRIEALLGLDVDAAALLERSRPEGVTAPRLPEAPPDRFAERAAEVDFAALIEAPGARGGAAAGAHLPDRGCATSGARPSPASARSAPSIR
ncbi:MAG: hypothetical protein U0359_01830 [Byssovorax sp.]